jgi:hypothetical protein
MTCDQFKLTYDHLGSVTRAERAACYRHVNECAGCQKLVDEMAVRVAARTTPAMRAFAEASARKIIAEDWSDPEFVAEVFGDEE